MKDLNVDIVRDNNYFVKSLLDGEVIRFFVSENDLVEKNQIIAVVKSDNCYLEITADFPGTVVKICADIDEPLKKWDDIAVVDVTFASDLNKNEIPVNSPDYTVIYTFQQEILPKLIYGETEKFIGGINQEHGKFIYFLLKEVYSNNRMIIPFISDDFKVKEEIFANDIIVVTITWPDVESPLLTRRSYILMHPQSRKIQYFTCERSLDGEFMISTIIPARGNLTRYNYGAAPEGLEAEKGRVIEIFIS